MRRDVETLIRRIREELRAEGSDGAGYSDFIIIEGINTAISDLSEIFPVRDTLTLTTQEEVNTYNLGTLFTEEINELLRVTYDGTYIQNEQIDNYFDMADPTEGSIRGWFLWGDTLTLLGEVEDAKEVELWVNRAPKTLGHDNTDTVPEIPGYADEAIVAHTVSICYRESRDYDRANYHYGIYLRQKNDLLRRGVPQKQRDQLPQVRSSYWGPFRPVQGQVGSDTDPGGRGLS